MVDEVFDASSGRGQLMERATIVQADPYTLDAIYLRGDGPPPLLVVPALFEPGGGMEGAVANELAYAAATHGHASLRFAWRGKAGSEGEFPEQPEGAVALLRPDIDAAAEHLYETAESGRIALAALRDGALAALDFVERKRAWVELLILVDPPGEVAAALPALPSFAFFPGEEPLPREFRELEGDPQARCQVQRIPDADRAFRRSLRILGEAVSARLGRAR